MFVLLEKYYPVKANHYFFIYIFACIKLYCIINLIERKETEL